MKKITLLTKTAFHTSNIGLILIYLYPGSLFGWLLYGDTQRQPQLTSDFLVSTNHFYAFTLLSALGLFSYHANKHKLLFLYFFSLSMLLELCHIIIPNRSYEFVDFLGNILGVFIIYILSKFMKF